ncbi:dTDP-4-dehydrorhamnose reductase [Halovivax limisalsi]|uniref:dTDP-4-dehydrorhamnose reductase n=1 Tax=Halovivax limisalsi TaxID=1453760 RepID=UPI001FFCDDCC|nr:dTDP-4-dehydrorhamnose reductase [Halovivax limisalsi]
MTLLVLGAGGLLGSSLVRHCLERSIDVAGTYHSTAPAFDIQLENHDIRNTAAFQSLLDEHRPDTVVNCAALTDVDECESRRERAFEVNGDAPGELATACVKRDVQFVHISTDYVFDGNTTEPYDETVTPSPIQVYGESKLEGEKAVRSASRDTLVTRLSFVYGVRGDTNELIGFPAWVRNTLQAEEKVPLFVDQHLTPTRAGQAVTTVLDLLEQGATGTYHIACRSCVTPYEFGKEIAGLQGKGEELVAKSTRSAVTRDADRPAYTCLDVGAVETELGRPQPTLTEDLQNIGEKLAV